MLCCAASVQAVTSLRIRIVSDYIEAMKSNRKTEHGDAITSIYPNAVVLLDYVTSISKCQRSRIVTVQDSDEYQRFVTTTFIVPTDTTWNDADHAVIPVVDEGDQPLSASLKEFLTAFVAETLRKSESNYRDQNCLILGYKTRKHAGELGMLKYSDVIPSFVNNIHAIVKGPVWQVFSSRVGEQLLRHILQRRVFMLCASSGGCYIQVAGSYVTMGGSRVVPPKRIATNTKDTTTNIGSNPTHPSHHRTPTSTAFTTAAAAVAGSVRIPRHKIFYNIARESTRGLPSKHALFQSPTLTALCGQIFGDYMRFDVSTAGVSTSANVRAGGLGHGPTASGNGSASFSISASASASGSGSGSANGSGGMMGPYGSSR